MQFLKNVKAKPRDKMSNADRGKGIISINIRYPFPVRLGYIYVYIVLDLVLENVNVESRMWINVKLRFKRLDCDDGKTRYADVSQRKRRCALRTRGLASLPRLCRAIERSMTLLVNGIERTCHLDIATPPPLSPRSNAL